MTPNMPGNPSSEAALDLYDSGLHVIPLPRGKKTPFGPLQVLFTSRLYRPLLADVCAGCNLAVLTGRLSGNLFIIDCDTIADYNRVRRELEERGIAAWVRSSHRGGQFWMFCADGEIANAGWQNKHDLIDTQILGNHKYSLVPPSVHPLGSVYEWVKRDGDQPPVVTLKQLDFLPLQLASVRRRRPPSGKQQTTLPPAAFRVLVQQDIRGYKSNSEAEYAACLSLIEAGWLDSAILTCLNEASPPHYTKVGAANFERYILAGAHVYVAANPLDQSMGSGFRRTAHSSVYLSWIGSRPWPGRAGPGNRVVFTALVKRYGMEGTMPFRASIREIADIAGVDAKTVQAGLRRLAALGLIHCYPQDKGQAANRYVLTVAELDGRLLPGDSGAVALTFHTAPTGDVGKTYCGMLEPPVSELGPLLGHDVWLPRALNRSGQQVWKSLLDTPGQTPQALASNTGRGRSTITRTLSRLTQHGLAAAAEGGGYAAILVSVARLNEIAAELGTLGRLQQRKDQHSEERAIWVTEQVSGQRARYGQKHACKHP